METSVNNKCKAFTSLEQSRKLAEILPNESADMRYERVYFEGNKSNWFIGLGKPVKSDDIIPAWSLSALLGLMPKSICIKKTNHSGYFYFLEWQFANDNSLRYVGHNRECLIDIYSDHDDNWKDYIDTAFEKVCWLKENKKI